MSIQDQVAVRSKKLGVLIRDARLSARKTLPKCAQLVGVPNSVLHSWEEGLTAPSLPELEVLAYVLQLPLHTFWNGGTKSKDASIAEEINLPVLIGLRRRLVGALLRQQRKNAYLSLKALSEQSGIPAARLWAYEMGERPIPLPELECLVALCGGQIEAIFDQKSRIGQWLLQQNAVQDFLQLPSELQIFISKAANRPYLELARKLSSMSPDKLRSVAEDLLEKISKYDL
jgi:transcriptional regulator with XRE-family HTH domain